MAADDEPRPRACGIALWQVSRSPGGCGAQRVEGRPHRPDDQVVLVEGHSGARAGHLDDQAGAGQLRLERVAQVEGQAERVEPGTEVGRGRRDLTRTGRDGHHRSPAASAAAVTSGSTTGSTSGPNPSSAVAMSLSPWPVTVTTTVLPA